MSSHNIIVYLYDISIQNTYENICSMIYVLFAAWAGIHVDCFKVDSEILVCDRTANSHPMKFANLCIALMSISFGENDRGPASFLVV